MKKYELEVFCKMLVDRHNKLKQDYKDLENKYESLEKEYKKLSNKLSASLDQLKQIEKDVLSSKPYKTVVKNNTELKKRIKSLERLGNNLMQQLLHSNSSL